jgi:hypothetical protein
MKMATPSSTRKIGARVSKRERLTCVSSKSAFVRTWPAPDGGCDVRLQNGRLPGEIGIQNRYDCRGRCAAEFCPTLLVYERQQIDGPTASQYCGAATSTVTRTTKGDSRLASVLRIPRERKRHSVW